MIIYNADKYYFIQIQCHPPVNSIIIIDCLDSLTYFKSMFALIHIFQTTELTFRFLNRTNISTDSNI